MLSPPTSNCIGKCHYAGGRETVVMRPLIKNGEYSLDAFRCKEVGLIEDRGDVRTLFAKGYGGISWSLDCLFAGCGLLPSFLGGPF